MIRIDCPDCKGLGHVPRAPTLDENGTPLENDVKMHFTAVCERCSGTGKIDGTPPTQG